MPKFWPWHNCLKCFISQMACHLMHTSHWPRSAATGRPNIQMWATSRYCKFGKQQGRQIEVNNPSFLFIRNRRKGIQYTGIWGPQIALFRKFLQFRYLYSWHMFAKSGGLQLFFAVGSMARQSLRGSTLVCGRSPPGGSAWGPPQVRPGPPRVRGGTAADQSPPI